MKNVCRALSVAKRVAAVLLVALALALPLTAHAQERPHVDVLTVSGTIDSWVAGYIRRGISVAAGDGAAAVVIVLNTPGGTLTAMQDITTEMLNARIPLVVFVAPAGAWAGSAGTFVALAANVLAMAPGTTIGAAHPVSDTGQNIPSDEQTKITNFSVSIIQNIARLRGRNADWAASAVRDSVSATAEEAFNQHVVDLMATDVNDLLNKIDGRSVQTAAGETVLSTRQAGLIRVDMNLPESFFHMLVDPNVALILLQLGLLAIALEIYHPGATVPGVTGSICLVLALITLGNLPVNWGGVILIAVSVILFIVDVKVNTLALTLGGLVCFIFGAMLLFTPVTPPSPATSSVSLSPVVVVALGVIMTAFFVFLLGAVVRGRRFPVVSGAEGLIGATGVAISDLNPEGLVRVRSELWSATAAEGTIHKGDAVQAVKVEGLKLKVVKK
jgi:membrane-bound serine protease (ClpP class)